MNDDAPDPRLADTLDTVWTMLAQGAADRAAPARHPVLATSGPAGPEARLLVLRAADRSAARLTFHTDAASGKCADLATDPRAAVLLWDPEAQFQVRLRVTAYLRPGSADEWAAVPDPSRRAYGGTPPPGAPLATPEAHDPAPDLARFTVIEAAIREIETLRLATPHERAIFRAADGFRGTWRAP